MSENLQEMRIEKEALLDYVNNKIATYVVEPSIYNYAYENSAAFRKFMDNTSDEMKKYFSEKDIATRAYRARVQRKQDQETTETEL